MNLYSFLIILLFSLSNCLAFEIEDSLKFSYGDDRFYISFSKKMIYFCLCSDGCFSYETSYGCGSYKIKGNEKKGRIVINCLEFPRNLIKNYSYYSEMADTTLEENCFILDFEDFGSISNVIISYKVSKDSISSIYPDLEGKYSGVNIIYEGVDDLNYPKIKKTENDYVLIDAFASPVIIDLSKLPAPMDSLFHISNFNIRDDLYLNFSKKNKGHYKVVLSAGWGYQHKMGDKVIIEYEEVDRNGKKEMLFNYKGNYLRLPLFREYPK